MKGSFSLSLISIKCRVSKNKNAPYSSENHIYPLKLCHHEYLCIMSSQVTVKDQAYLPRWINFPWLSLKNFLSLKFWILHLNRDDFFFSQKDFRRKKKTSTEKIIMFQIAFLFWFCKLKQCKYKNILQPGNY